jgi:hypothetical protein
MADWPIEAACRVEYTNLAPNPFTGVGGTPRGGADVMGSYATLGYAPFDCSGIMLMVRNHSSATDYLADIAFGAAGSENVVIESLYTTGPSSSSRSKQYFFPLFVPAGTRVSARCQNATISTTLAMAVGWFEQTWLGAPSCQRIVTYGAVRSTSSGTPLAAPGANAWGAWTVLTAATLADHSWIMPIYGDQDLGTRTAQSHAYQTAIGATGSERILHPPIMFHASSTALQGTFYPHWWMRIPHGQQLQMRYAAVAATNLGLDTVIYAGVS